MALKEYCFDLYTVATAMSLHMVQFCHLHSSFVRMHAQIYTHPKLGKVARNKLAWHSPPASTEAQQWDRILTLLLKLPRPPKLISLLVPTNPFDR